MLIVTDITTISTNKVKATIGCSSAWFNAQNLGKTNGVYTIKLTNLYEENDEYDIECPEAECEDENSDFDWWALIRWLLRKLQKPIF